MSNTKNSDFDERSTKIRINPDETNKVRKELPKDPDSDRKAGNFGRCPKHGVYRGHCPFPAPHN